MEDELIHDLVAGYALDALSGDQDRVFEAHLAHCPTCRQDLAAFTETAAELGFAAPSASPPPELRGRILETAREDGARVVPLRPRWVYPVLAAAAAAVCAAIGLGVWAATLHSRLGSTQALHGIPLSGAGGSVVLGRGGEAALVVSGLATPPVGKAYEVWVIRGETARPAGLFSPRAGTTTVVRLDERVASGDRVGVTLEPKGGSPHPTSKPLVLSARA